MATPNEDLPNPCEVKQNEGEKREREISMKTEPKTTMAAITVKDKTVARCKSGMIGIALLFALALLALYMIWPSGNGEKTIGEVRREFVATLNTELSNRSCPIIKRIEDAHGTVTVSRAYVLKCDITTIDGSNKADAISLIRMTIRFNWDGIIHQGGTTDLELDLTADGKCTRSRIIRTDALINMEDPDFWYNVGAGIGALLAL